MRPALIKARGLFDLAGQARLRQWVVITVLFNILQLMAHARAGLCLCGLEKEGGIYWGIYSILGGVHPKYLTMAGM